MAVEGGRITGIVSRFSNQKGYGFIKPDGGTEDVFVHQSEIKAVGFRSLYEGQKVEFVVTGNGDKYQAVDVTSPGGTPLDGSRNGGGSRVSNRRNNGSGGECYNCGRVGHIARDCDRDRDRDRDRDGNNGGGGACYTCGMTGHIARDCDHGHSGGACYNCGGFGHMARDCTSERRGGGGGGGNGACYNCGLPGHLARECSRQSGGGDRFGRWSFGGSKCYNCGETGHFARECTSPAVK